MQPTSTPQQTDTLQKEKDQLTFDILRAFGRSEGMINLLHHLPYIKQLEGDDRDEV